MRVCGCVSVHAIDCTVAVTFDAFVLAPSLLLLLLLWWWWWWRRRWRGLSSTLDFADNTLTGEIPDSFSDLAKIR
jgi:hypothetical protein